MNWKGYGRKQLRLNVRYYPGICLEGFSKTTKTVRIASPVMGPPKYNVQVSGYVFVTKWTTSSHDAVCLVCVSLATQTARWI
jgi:hypothetical protein